jgi:energy-coupling factor transporter ATP-binding protein EcfA2
MTLDIEVAGLRLRYGEVTALDDLILTLEGGRIYGLLGRNGAGMTSLLSVPAGLREPQDHPPGLPHPRDRRPGRPGPLRAVDRGTPAPRLGRRLRRRAGSGQLPMVFVGYWAMLVVWTTIGLLLAAGFYRSGGSELVAVVLAPAMVVVTGYGIGFSGLPSSAPSPTCRWPGPSPCAWPACSPGAAATWPLVRDPPIRNP